MQHGTFIPAALILLALPSTGCDLLGPDRDGLSINTDRAIYKRHDVSTVSIRNLTGHAIYLRMCDDADGTPTFFLEKHDDDSWQMAAAPVCPRWVGERRLSNGEKYAFTTQLEGYVQTLDTIPGTYRFQFWLSHRSYLDEGEHELALERTISNEFEIAEEHDQESGKHP